MNKISGYGSLKFEDLGQGGQRYALSGLIIGNDWAWWWWYGKFGGGVIHCQ